MRLRSSVLCVLLFASFLALSPSPARCVSWQQVTQFTGQETQQLDTAEFRYVAVDLELYA